MRASYFGLVTLGAVLFAGLSPAPVTHNPPRSSDVYYVSDPALIHAVYPVAAGRFPPPRPVVPPRSSYTPSHRSPMVRPTTPPPSRFPGTVGPGYVRPLPVYPRPIPARPGLSPTGAIGPRITTVNRGAGFTAAVNTLNRPWWNYHRSWYYGAWYNWPAYPALWARLASGYWLTPWASDVVFVYDNPYYQIVVPPIENPYLYVVPRGLDYSLPLPVPTEAQADKTDEAVVSAAMACFDRARVYFKVGRYADATAEMDRAVRLLPGDRSMQEFRALTLFAREEYAAAAAGIYAVLSAGPGWDWNTMAGLYPDGETYTRQLRALEVHVRHYPTEGSGHFLLAYHYLVLNHLDEAVVELRTAATLAPKDKLSAALAEALSR